MASVTGMEVTVEPQSHLLELKQDNTTTITDMFKASIAPTGIETQDYDTFGDPGASLNRTYWN